MNLSTMAFPRRFSCDGAARSSATPSRQRRAGVNEDTAETSVLRGLARLNRLSLIWLTHPPRMAGRAILQKTEFGNVHQSELLDKILMFLFRKRFGQAIRRH